MYKVNEATFVNVFRNEELRKVISRKFKYLLNVFSRVEIKEERVDKAEKSEKENVIKKEEDGERSVLKVRSGGRDTKGRKCSKKKGM